MVFSTRFWLDRERRLRDRAMFDLAIDSKLRGCDVVKIKIGELVSGGQVLSLASIIRAAPIPGHSDSFPRRSEADTPLLLPAGPAPVRSVRPSTLSQVGPALIVDPDKYRYTATWPT